MTEELTTTKKEIANTQAELPMLQAQLGEWCREKLVEVRQHEAELRAAYEQARKQRWNSSALLRAANKELQRVEFYEKVLAALDAGYMLFPPIEEVDLIAIRTNMERHPYQENVARNAPPWNQDTQSEAPPAGEGEYKKPMQRWTGWGTVEVKRKRADGSEYRETVNNWNPVTAFDKPDFPLVMARAQCVQATSAAMEMKIFDDIAIYPPRAKKDPVILGRIHDPKGSRKLNFLISWRVDKRDL